MRVALLTGGLPAPALLAPHGIDAVRDEADVALAHGWEALDALTAAPAARRVLLVDGVERAPRAVDHPVALVATGRWLADLLPGRTPVVRPGRPEDVVPTDPQPLTRGPLTDEVLVHPTTAEHAVAAFAEAATVVAPATPALREVVTDGHDGLLVAPRDRRAVRREVQRLDDDRALLHLLRHNARRTALGWPSAAQQATVLAAVLRKVAREPEPAPPGELGLPRERRWLRRR